MKMPRVMITMTTTLMKTIIKMMMMMMMVVVVVVVVMVLMITIADGPQKWDRKLAAVAAKWALQCTFAHDEGTARMIPGNVHMLLF